MKNYLKSVVAEGLDTSQFFPILLENQQKDKQTDRQKERQKDRETNNTDQGRKTKILR